jgi:pimeloyl-ACP methyl ester carboxylesterase
VTNIYKSEEGKQKVEALYRLALQRWPVPNRQLLVPTCQGDTFVIASGEQNQEAVVLLHGSGTNSAIWLRDVAELATRYRVYAIDIIGEPGLSSPSRPPLKSDAHASWLDGVWNHLGLARASIVGVSLGGWLALDYAVRRPERVTALSLVSPSGIGSQNQLFMLKAGLLLMLGKWGLRKSFKAAAGNSKSVPSAAAAFVTTIFQHFRPRMERIPIRTDAELAGLKMPLQVVIGGNDALIRSKDTRDRVRRLVPHAEVVYLEREGHILPSQSAAIGAFLRDATRRDLRSEIA